ncbi:uncharacterized protein LOC122083962 [Macadamia integrifolia]|uniref:uncharacterized protein LOC122083962 n=1 Tax=Macadamia integrifolia TaxID=60698 RepID=UPI001C4E73E0|nr:uncharacterized protein LOC122083962 [Macadamia integrifolia]
MAINSESCHSFHCYQIKSKRRRRVREEEEEGSKGSTYPSKMEYQGQLGKSQSCYFGGKLWLTGQMHMQYLVFGAIGPITLEKKELPHVQGFSAWDRHQYWSLLISIQIGP